MSIFRRLFGRKIGPSENAVDSVQKPGATGSADSHSPSLEGGANHPQIEVPNKWGEGDGSPLLVEQDPNLERIFTDPHPPLPQRLTEDNREFWEGASPLYVRQVLAAAYFLHPDPNVRLATLRLTKDVWVHNPLPQALVDTLADPSQDVRVAAAQVIWGLSPDAKLESKVTFALACLRDEIEGTGMVSTTTHVEAQQGLEGLRDCRPDRRTDFNRWLIYAWCRRKKDLAEYGYRLLDIYGQQGSFLGPAEEETRRIGRAIGNMQDRQMISSGIGQVLGTSAARELEGVWEGSREPLPTFNKVETREVTKATDALFNEALSAVPAIAPHTIMAAHKALKNAWGSQALYSGIPTQMRKIVSHNLGLLARRPNFVAFIIDTMKDAQCAQVNALYERAFIGVRLWRSPDRIFVCGNADFEGPQEAEAERGPEGLVKQHVGLLPFAEPEIEGLVKQHVARLRTQLADSIPASQWDLLIRPDILAFTIRSIARQVPLSRQENAHKYRGQWFSDAIVVVSVVPALRSSQAMTYFPKGYIDTQISLINTYQYNLEGSSPFIHWIYCFDSNYHMIHLSLHFPKALKIRTLLVAQDLLSKEEKTQFLGD